jgi:thioredoxin-like negative regulator of GroEL
MRYALAMVLMLLVADARGDGLVIFTRPGCPPCDSLKAAIAKDTTLVAGFELYKVDTAERPDIAQKYGVKAVPVVVLLRDGKELRRRLGFTSADDLRAWLDDAQFRRQWR